VETRLIAMPRCLFRRLCPFWREIALLVDRMECEGGGSDQRRIGQFGTNFSANEAGYALMAVIIAGTPMMFMTRVML